MIFQPSRESAVRLFRLSETTSQFTNGFARRPTLGVTSPTDHNRTHAAYKSRGDSHGSILVVSDPRHHLFGMPILAQLASDHVLDTAHEWLCRRRRDYSANSNVWAFRRDWVREKERIKGELLSGNYRFSLLSRITLEDGEDTDLWSARDALVEL
jgi:hypothetical protein